MPRRPGRPQQEGAVLPLPEFDRGLVEVYGADTNKKDPKHGGLEQERRKRMLGRDRTRACRKRKKARDVEKLMQNMTANEDVEDEEQLFEFLNDYGDKEVIVF